MLRRSLLAGLPMFALARPALADAIGLSVACDTAIASALRLAGSAYRQATGARIYVFPTGPGLLLPQLERNIQNDILVSQLPILDQASQARLISAVPGPPHWRNPLVIAGLPGAAIDHVFAVPDPTPASDIDGPALLAKLGLKPARVLGAVDTDEVAAMLDSGAAQAGLLHMTDVRANPRLAVLRPVPSDVQPPLIYAASVTRLASRPNPQAFIEFLATPEAKAVLTDAGLELQP